MRRLEFSLLISLCSQFLLSNSAYAEESWKASNVQWQVFREQDQNQGQVCKVLWIYDDLIGLSLSNNQHNQFYFVLDLPAGGSNFPKFKPNYSYEGWLIKHDRTEMPLSIQAISQTRAVLLLDDVSINEEYISTASRILINIHGKVMEFPLENTMENLEVYSQCRQTEPQTSIAANSMPSPAISKPAIQKVAQHSPQYKPPIIQEASKPNYSGVEIAAEFSESVAREIGGQPSLSSMSEPKINSIAPTISQQMLPVSSGLEISSEFAPRKKASQMAATPTLLPPEPIKPANDMGLGFDDHSVSSVRMTAPMPETEPHFDPMSAIQAAPSHQQNEVLEAAYKQEIAATTKAASPDVSPLMATAKTAGKQGDQIIKNTRYIQDDTACEASAQKPSDAIEAHKASAENDPAMKSLIKKLALLEKEKEELRKKLLSVTQNGYISDIVACEPAGQADTDKEISDTIIAQFEANIERLREENQDLIAQIDSENSDLSQSREENDALHQQILELTKRNQELQSEVYNYREQVEMLNSFENEDTETNVSDDEADAEITTDNDEAIEE